MPEVVDCVKKSNADKEMRARMEDRENSQIYLSLIRGNGYQKGMKDGEKKGEEKGKKDIIKTMLSNGLPKEDIIKFTGISEEDLNKIINS